MKTAKPQKIPAILLIFILLTANALYWCVQKEGYYIDELWSYGLSNSFGPSLYQNAEYMDRWQQPSFYQDYLTAKPGEVFSYGSVRENQILDTHPPLFYMVLHTVCSLFPNRFSKWFGLIPNLIFFHASVFLLYKISGLILGKTDPVRALPPLLYGMSAGAVSTLLYIRMYMLLTFFALLFVFLSFLLLTADTDGKRTPFLAAICLSVTAGFLTQYYFIVFVFFFSAGYVLWHMLLCRWRNGIEYSLAVCAGIACGILIFPASLRHIFSGSQGARAFKNLHNIRSFFSRLRAYETIVANEFWGKGAWKQLCIFLAFLGLIIAAAVLTHRKKQKLHLFDTVSKAECLVLFGTVFGYFSLIAQIAPEAADRYQFVIYPFLILLSVSVYSYLFRLSGKTNAIWIMAACFLFFLINNYNEQSLPYVYRGYQQTLDILSEEYKTTPGIYVTAGDHLVINNCLFLAQQELTYPITLEKIGQYPPPEFLETNSDSLILYVDIYYDESQTAKQIGEMLGYPSCSLLYDNTFTQIYILHHNENK